MADNQTGSSDDLADIGVWILAALAIGALWKGKVRPWLDSTWASLSGGDAFHLGGLSVDTTDIVGLGALLLVAALVIRALRKKSKRKKSKGRSRERDERER